MCKLLLPEQQVQVGVERSDPAPAGSAPGCIWLSVPGVKPDVTIELEALDMGFEEAVGRAGEPFPETAASYEIDGFKAEQGQEGAGLESLGCRVDVDVAQGQTLEVFYSPTLSGTVTNQDMCAKAKQAAEFAVTNLQAQG